MGKLVALVLLGVGLSLVGEMFLAFRERVNASREVEPVEPENCHLIEELGIKISRHAKLCAR
ncbi:PON3 isoform 6 [Pan troglodytes]|uniref:Paraoxonase 3 n=2 Tax=Homininae TaxID=207598 RepID=F8WBV4_HUMAN|nr:paraoxonase 3 [Homo sapiens]KAI4014679.1 paraoxonase 3 [Homo sapiens]PNI42122.1 PON3 isoform 6 [Pan troglodytes]